MQTFLPYPDFAQSAAALDKVRLGKQRVETLQILRAITFPSYGWTNHPATTMWRGRVPALVNYGVAMVDEWVSRGAADTTRAQIAEFAPQAANFAQQDVELPSWLGDPELHRSHQSNLIRKDAEFYSPQFPGVPGNLEYVWPAADDLTPRPLLEGSPLWIVRATSDDEFAGWVTRGEIVLGERSPAGRMGPKWLAQLEVFRTLPVGTRFATLLAGAEALPIGTIVGDFTYDVLENDTEELVRPVTFAGMLSRSDFPYPALLQDPRSLFETVGPL